MCLYDAAAIASATTCMHLPNPASAVVIAGILDLQNVQPEGSPTKLQDKPSADLLAFQLDGEQQAGHVK